ncbi:MAG: MMPL family transporter [Pirellulales bacterium]
MRELTHPAKTEPSFFGRWALWILIFFALIVPSLGYGAHRAIKSNSNKMEDWLPSSFAETHQFAWFREHFADDQFVLISWDGCRLGDNPARSSARPDDPRIERLAAALVPDTSGTTSPTAGGTPNGYFKTATTGRRMLNQLTGPPLSIPYATAVDRLSGSLIGPDGRQTCVVVTLSDKAVDDLRAAIGRGQTERFRIQRPPGLLFETLEKCGIPADSVHLGGPPVDNVAIDEEGERTLLRLVGLSGIVGIGLAWWSFRSIRLTVFVFATGVLSAISALAVIAFSGGTMDAILMSMPAVVYVAGISGAIHIINYFHDAFEEALPEYDGDRREPPAALFASAADRAIADAWVPCLLCSLTTAIGFFSLCTSNLVPIRKFGIYSGIGVLLTLAILFTALPAALTLWPVRRRMPSSGGFPLAIPARWRSSGHSVFRWPAVAGGILRNHGWVVAGCTAVMLLMAAGLQRIETSVEIMKLFSPRARIIADYQWLERNLGNLVPIEVVLKLDRSIRQEDVGTADQNTAYFDPAGYFRLGFADRMQLVERVQQQIESLPEVDRAMSAATFGPAPPQRRPGGLGGVLFRPDLQYQLIRRQLGKSLSESRDSYIASGFLREDEHQTELWRVTARVEALSGVDYAHFVTQIEQQVKQVIAAYALRDQIGRQLAASRKSLEGSRVCVVGISRKGGGRIVPDERALMLLDLLRSAGATISYSDDRLPRLPAPRPYLLPELLSQAPSGEFVRRQDCIVSFGEQKPADWNRFVSAAKRGALLLDGGHFLTSHTAQSNSPEAKGAMETNAAGSHEPQTISAVYTGVVPLVYRAEHALLQSLFQSVAWAFVTISAVMMLQLRSITGGLVSMLPNMFPIVIVFGALGWSGIVVDIGTVMAASVGLGIAVDDTIHYLTWFRRGRLQGLRRDESAMFAYRRCARAMFQTSVIGGLGLAVFAFSTFTPTERFGYMMLVLLAAAFVGDILFLPALVAGPLGAAFRGRSAVREAPHFAGEITRAARRTARHGVYDDA